MKHTSDINRITSKSAIIKNNSMYYAILSIFAVWFFMGCLLRMHPLWYHSFRFYYHTGVLLFTLFMIQFIFGKTGSITDFSQKDRKLKKQNTILLCVLMFLSISGYYNIGRFHGNDFIHYHEVVHYYLGSKYFPELGYHDLYNAFLAADKETGNSFHHIAVVRDLRSGELVKAATLSEQIKAVPLKFTPERWQAFKNDFLFFKNKHEFKNLLLDHGYNPSPIWTLEARSVSALISLVRISIKQTINTIVFMDVIFLVFMFVMIWYAFGFYTMVFSLIFWGANPMVLYDFTGGAFMRQNWLVSLITGICLFKKKKELLAGAFIANSVGVRLFPGVFMIMPAVQFVYKWVTEKKFPFRLFRFGASTVIFFCILAAFSLCFSGGIDAWTTFFKNTTAHNNGIYTNHISYRNVFVYEVNKNAASYKDRGSYYHEHWRLDKEQRVARLKPVFYVSVILIMGMLFYLFRNDSPEKGLYIGGFFPFLLFYPANYYAMYLLPIVFLLAEEKYMLMSLFAILAIGFSVYYLPNFDVANIALSFLILFLLALVMVWQSEKVLQNQ